MARSDAMGDDLVLFVTIRGDGGAGGGSSGGVHCRPCSARDAATGERWIKAAPGTTPLSRRGGRGGPCPGAPPWWTLRGDGSV